MKILAVDDNQINLELIRDIAESGGYDVITARNGMSALQLAESDLPDLVVLDVNMPGMSGYEVCARMKADPKLNAIPVIILTAMQDINSRVQGLDAGADDYLSKPFSARELLARIETRLRAKTESDGLREMQKLIRDTFSRFVAPSVVEQLLKDPTQVKLGGNLQTITVMFTDLQNFTTTSESTPPEQLLTILNTHHELVVRIIQAHGGTIDKFIGDAVMALFNTPLLQPDHTLRALRAALEIQAALPAFHQQFTPDFRMKINMGVHTGVAVVGNVGTPQLMDYTAVGDTVNVAARLQTRGRDGQIIISQAVYNTLASGSIHATELGSIALKGRTGAVIAYELLGLAE
ncbi:MAG: response regulator [Armatimonadetes bacterium]|nr:response regulator [Anaerolineae bacterium]